MPGFLSRLTKKNPQLGGSNPKNIDSMVAAGILTKKEGERAKKRLAKNKK